MRRIVGLLRAVNVGGRTLHMDALRAAAGAAGFERPETLLASGNLLISTALDDPAAEAALEAAVTERCGFAAEVLVRDAAHLAAILKACPFEAFAAAEPNRLLVLFQRGEPGADLKVLADRCGAGEAVALGPGCLYATFPEGSGNSKLTTAVIERRLGVRVTGRNWNTVRRIAARLEATP